MLGCGGDDESSSGGSRTASGDFITQAEDSTDKAVAGGRFVYDRQDVQTLDPFATVSAVRTCPTAWSTVVSSKTRPARSPRLQLAKSNPMPPENWENTPDGLTHTLKLRRGMKSTAARPPTAVS